MNKIVGRIISEDFIKKIKYDYSFIVEYVKKNNDVFLGIRNNKIILYVHGGAFFNLWCNGKKEYIASINYDGYRHELDSDLEKSELLQIINGKEISKYVNDWKELFDYLKKSVKKHQEASVNGKICKEKILQQNYAQKINEKKKYYCYDIEYNIEGFRSYNVYKDGTLSNDTNDMGRFDNLVFKINDNKINLYLVEIKNDIGAFNRPSIKRQTFGSGIMGHINGYMETIYYIKEHKDYKLNYYKNVSINFYDLLLSEIKHKIHVLVFLGINKYSDFNIKDESDLNKLVIANTELVFYLGDYHHKDLFERHLGIKGNDSLSVMKLLNNNPLSIVYTDHVSNFKYHKSSKSYDNLDFDDDDLNIEKYNTITAEKIDKMWVLKNE